MATPPQSTSSSSRSRSLNIPSLTIYVGAGALTLVSAITVSAVFYLLFGPLGAILTAVLYSLALAGIFCCKRVVGMVCYPRYEMLSERRKSEVDEVRKRGIERLLEGATLMLKNEHLMHKTTALTCKSESSITSATAATVESSTTSSASSSLVSSLEHFISSLECDDDEQDNEVDLELGNVDAVENSCAKNDDHDDDMPSSSSEKGGISVVIQLYKEEDEDSFSPSSSFECAETETEYTHVRVPRSDMMQCTEDSSTHSLTEENKNATLPTANTTSRTREVPINCPICLSSYEPDQSICCSSNPQCPHVFHSECITHWFVEMGRRNNDIIIRHWTKLDEHSLLDYTLSCPCCRQPFLKRELLLTKDAETEEKQVVRVKMTKMTSKVAPMMGEDEEQVCPV